MDNQLRKSNSMLVVVARCKSSITTGKEKMKEEGNG